MDSYHPVMDRVTTDDLRRNDLFRDVPKKSLINLARGARRQVFSCHDALSFSLDGIACLYLVEKGTLAVYCKTELPVKEGDSKYLLCLRTSKHAVIGEFMLANEEMPESTVEAINDCQLIAVPVRALSQFAERYPLVYERLFKAVVRKLVAERRHAEAIQLESEKQSVCLAQTILNLADEFGTDDEGKIQCYIDERFLCGYTSEKLRTVKDKMEVLEKKCHLIWFNNSGLIQIRNRREMERFVRTSHSTRRRKRTVQPIWPSG